jgi:hypothetical protein
MEKTFRDILVEFLEGDEAEITPVSEVKSPFSEGNSTVFEPLWRPDFAQNPAHFGMNRYRTSFVQQEIPVTPPPKVSVAPPTPPPVPETIFPLDKLSAANSARAKELIALGATNLTQGLSITRLKKAHRLLARKFHPDRLNGATPEQVRIASLKFMAAQTAYNELLEFLLETESQIETQAA